MLVERLASVKQQKENIHRNGRTVGTLGRNLQTTPYEGEGSLNGLRTSSTGGGSMFSAGCLCEIR